MRLLIIRSEEHTSELQSLTNLVCRLLLEKKRDALLVSRGTLVEDHVAQIKAVEGLNLDTSKPMILVDKLRRMRHHIIFFLIIRRQPESTLFPETTLSR